MDRTRRLPFPRNDYRLVLRISLHSSVSFFGNSKQMRFQVQLVPLLSRCPSVHLDNILPIDRDVCKRIDGDKDYSTVGVELFVGYISIVDDMED